MTDETTLDISGMGPDDLDLPYTASQLAAAKLIRDSTILALHAEEA